MNATNSREGPSKAQASAARQIERNNYVAMVAHELRDPLMPIMNAAAVLLQCSQGGELVRQSAAVIDRQARIMSGLIDDLMNVSRLQSGMLRLERAQVSMAEIVRRCVETAGPFFVARNQQLRVSMSDISMELDADAARLIQALRNLMVNASKFSEPGSQVQVIAEREGADAVVRVVDSGIGIEKSDLEPIFSMFIQGANQASRANGGLGIGLYLARHYTEAHGGTLTATSEGHLRGSTFTLRVPCIPISRSSDDPIPASLRHNTRKTALRDADDRAR